MDYLMDSLVLKIIKSDDSHGMLRLISHEESAWRVLESRMLGEQEL